MGTKGLTLYRALPLAPPVTTWMVALVPSAIWTGTGSLGQQKSPLPEML